MIKKIIYVSIIIMLFLTSFISISTGVSTNKQEENNINISYFFEKPIVNKIEINNKYFDRVSMSDCNILNIENEPRLPMFGVNILIPDGYEIDNILVTGNKIKLDGSYNVELGTKQIPLSQITQSSNIHNNEKQLYTSDSLYPNKLYDKVCVQRYHGYNILILNLYPVKYLQSSGELFYYPELKVNIETVNDNTKLSSINKNIKDEEIIKLVDNPELINTYSNIKNSNLKSSTFSDDSKMVIITAEGLVSYFQSLADYHNSHGVSTFFKTVEEIKTDSSYRLNGEWGDGNSNNPFITEEIDDEFLFDNLQAWIRNYIRYAYQELGVNYVLLGGDTSIIPEKKLPIEPFLSDSTYNVPTDIYYGGLDNSFYLEEDQEDIYMDFIPEVSVGRACVETSTEVQNFVDKTIEYMSLENDPYLNKILLAGEYLGFLDWGYDDGVDYGGNWLDQLIDVCIDDYYYRPDSWHVVRTLTSGIPSNQYEIDKLYDKYVNNFNPAIPELTGWQKSDILDKLNSNYHIVLHDGHGNEFHNMKLDHPYRMKSGVVGLPSSDLNGLRNSKPFFVYSHACNSGAFDDYKVLGTPYDCIAEYMTVKTSYGAFAGLWNSRAGWGGKDLHNGASQWYSREFWDAIFYEEITSIGKANDDSKIDNLIWIGDEHFRMIHTGLNLFGDPAVNLHVNLDNNLPEVPETPKITTQNTAYAYAPCTFSTKSTDSDYDKLYYGWDWNNNNKIGTEEWTGPYEPGEEAVASHIFKEPGQYIIKVCAMDKKLNPTDFSNEFSFEIRENQKPEKPNEPSGNSKYKPNIEYDYTTSSNDADGDELYYQFRFFYVETVAPMEIPIRWSFEYSDWLGPFESGENATAAHTWSREIYNRHKIEIDPQSGMPTYVTVEVDVKAKDGHGAESGWSPSLYLHPKKSFCRERQIDYNFEEIYYNLINRFPILTKLIKNIF